MATFRRFVALALLAAGISATFAAEGRTPVFAAGTVITQPGAYVLTRNLAGTGLAPVVEIAAPRVELDLNGFEIDGGGNRGVLVSSFNDVKIRNGSIVGADVGVEIPGAGGGNAVIEDLRIVVPASAGIRVQGLETLTLRRVVVHLSQGDGLVVHGNGVLTQGRIESCQVLRAAGVGIRVEGARGLRLAENLVGNSGLEGIRLDGVVGAFLNENQVAAAGGAAGIDLLAVQGATLSRNVVTQCRAHGIRLGGGSSDTHLVGNVASTNGIGGPPAYGDGIRVESLRCVLEGNVLHDNNGVGLHVASSGGYCTLGRNDARGNQNLAGSACGTAPALFPPNSCNDGVGTLTTFGDNLIPGPALF